MTCELRAYPTSENVRRAFDLRDRVSEREKLTIELHFYLAANGDLQKARQAYELWAQTYPRDSVLGRSSGS